MGFSFERMQELWRLRAQRDGAISVDRIGGFAGAYILASNMYAMGGLKGDSARMRMTVKETGMHVAPGFSSVRVDTKLHRFIAIDESHPRKLEILFILRHLHLSMKSKKTNTSEIEYIMM